MDSWVGEVAHQVELVPLLFVGGLHLRGHRRAPEWWWLAGALFVSWLADTVVDLGANADLVGTLYPITQAAIVGAVLLDRDEATIFVAALGVAAVTAVVWHGTLGIDVLLRTVAWLGAAGIAYTYKAIGGRWSLLVTFGAGWACWMAYAAFPGAVSWLAYKAAWATGIGLFCWAAYDPAPHFSLSRSHSRRAA